MDNFHFDISARQKLREWLRLAFNGHQATHWKVEKTGGGNNRLLLGQNVPSDKTGWNQLVGPSDADLMATTVQSWLDKQDRGSSPDIDGSIGPAFRIYNEEFGGVGDDHYAFIAIEPIWALYHK